jgi:Zn finger protein HypA/HybF involved in hydrogenase expression
MKIKHLLSAFLALIIVMFQSAEAQTSQDLTLQIGKQKKVFKNKLTVQFVSVLEDSRCPEGVDCIWAGNAKVQIKVKKTNGAWETLEINSNLKPQSQKIEGYEIKLKSLTPYPKVNVKTKPETYKAVFSIQKMPRS